MSSLPPASRASDWRSGVHYEVACAVIGILIGHFSYQAAVALDAPEPRDDEIEEAERFIEELNALRDALRPQDTEGIDRLIARLSPLARHLNQDLPAGSPQAECAAHFRQVNASLRLSGMPVSLDDLAIQARIIRGELTADQAVALYQGA
jgi:phytoene dehydrogenase-like protein